MDETLINSWVNPTRMLLDEDYRSVLTYVEPPEDGYWDIPISSNAMFFIVFEPFDQSLPGDQRLPLEFERLNKLHGKHGSKFEDTWSSDKPFRVKNYKIRKLMKDEFIQYTLTRRGYDYIQTQADFPCMNPEKVFLFLRSAMCDFSKIYANIHPALVQKFNLPSLEHTQVYTEGYEERSLGATNFSKLGVVFKRVYSDVKQFVPITSMHCLTRRQLEVTLNSVQKSKHTTDEVKFEIT